MLVRDRMADLAGRLADLSDTSAADDAADFAERYSPHALASDRCRHRRRRAPRSPARHIRPPCSACAVWYATRASPAGGHNALRLRRQLDSPADSRIDTNRPFQARKRRNDEKATHFNPVVSYATCAAQTSGSAYHLPDYVDADTGFISSKSFDGRDLRALELPGLWNGAMSPLEHRVCRGACFHIQPCQNCQRPLRPAHQ